MLLFNPDFLMRINDKFIYKQRKLLAKVDKDNKRME